MSSVEVPPIPRPTIALLLRAQRKVILVALAMIVASFWVIGPLASWVTASCAAGGVLLGLLNHLYTELWLGNVISGGGEPTRSMLTRSTMFRLGILSAVALGVAFVVGPPGIALIFGLAIFRLIALVMTGLPLLKELKNA
ncbi:MAG TPA: hypothetical protein VLI04_01030 [Nocardioidaceae bacterium]|nr:hypothetical protein [Nocardioidaceae bacterium]